MRPILPALVFVVHRADVRARDRRSSASRSPSRWCRACRRRSTFIAADKGYFSDAGLDVKIERIDSLSKAVAFVATNQVQVGQGGINAGYLQRAWPKACRSRWRSRAARRRSITRSSLRPELKDKIKTVADLKGRTVGISSPGSTSVYEIGMVLASAGLRLKDIDLKYLGLHPDGPGARQRRARRGARRWRRSATSRSSRRSRCPGSIRRTATSSSCRSPTSPTSPIPNGSSKSPDVARRAVRGAGARRPRLLPSLSPRPQPRRGGRHHDQEQDRDRPRPARPHGLAGAQPRTARSTSPASTACRTFFKQEDIIDKTAPREPPGRCELRARPPPRSSARSS